MVNNDPEEQLMSAETRLDEVERELARVSSRLRRLEGPAEVGDSTPEVTPPRSEPYVPPAFRPSDERRAAPAPRERNLSGFELEELFGGRVLAWIGGLAIFIGAVLFMAMAISRGWIDEETRTVIAALGSIALLIAGAWLQERKGRTEAAQAAVASALAGLYATLVFATQVYDLIPIGSGLIFGALIAGTGFALAVRWSSPLVAALGSLGALSVPLLTGVGAGSGVSIAFVGIALAATVAILLWQRWGWLALAAFLVSAPQAIAWIVFNEDEHQYLVLSVLVGFWALYVLAAFGTELRARSEAAVPATSWLLLLGSAAFLVSCGYDVLDQAGDQAAGVIWLFGSSAAHLLLGGAAIRFRVNREIGSLLIGLGIGLAGLGLADALDGPALVAAWAATAAALAALATRTDATPSPALSSAERLLLGGAGFLGLAVTHTLAVEAPPEAIVHGVNDLGPALGALTACAAAAFTCGWFASSVRGEASVAANFLAAAALVYLGSILIVDTIGVTALGESRQAGQVWLSAFWTVTGLGAVVWGLVRRSAEVRLGGLALLGIAIAKVWTYDLAQLEELARVLSFIGLGLLLLVGAFAYQRIKPGKGADEREPRASL